jgi:hypothetical protein
LAALVVSSPLETWVIPMPTSQFPEDGILWRDWSDETLRAIDEKKWPVLLFVADPDPRVWPFLREVFKEMPANRQAPGPAIRVVPSSAL